MNAVSRYQSRSIQTASPQQVVVMLYDGAIRFLNNALSALDDDDTKARCESLKQALAIIHHLHAALDVEAAGEVGTNLDALYVYMEDHLLRVNRTKEWHRIDECISILTELRSAWDEAARTL